MTISALWVRHDSVYRRLGIECYDRTRDARNYAGPGPVICHPPCGPWGKYWKVSHETVMDGLLAVRMVDRFGGVVEQPEGSALLRYRPVVVVDQWHFGHMAKKRTMLYFNPMPILPAIPERPMIGVRPLINLSKRQREQTPEPFARWLIQCVKTITSGP